MSASDLRKRARDSLVGNYWPAVLTAFVAAILGGLLTSQSVSLQLNDDFVQTLWQDFPSVAAIYLATMGGIGTILSIVAFVIGGVVQMGYAKYLLQQQDGKSGDIKDLFSQFDYFAQGFLQSLLRTIFIVLWSLLFVIPGIVKAFSYAMTPFIMAENPGMKARDAINASKQMMQGHKGELFCLHLSFIGWYILCGFTLGIGIVFLNPYVNAAYAAFYRNICPKRERTFDIPQPDVNGTTD